MKYLFACLVESFWMSFLKFLLHIIQIEPKTDFWISFGQNVLLDSPLS